MIELIDNIQESLSRQEIADFLPFANRRIADLCKGNSHLLPFPNSLSLSEDGIGDSPIFTFEPNGDDYVNVKAGNILGFIGINGKRMKIRSRFDESGKDYFLNYMLQRVLAYHIINLPYSYSSDNSLNLLVLLFPVYLREALQQGAYREYRRFMRNDANIRGTIDVPRHLRYNTPFQGNVAYSVRDHTPDNMIMHLIRHTIEYLKSQKLGAAILNADKDIIMDVQQVYRLTETYKKSERQMVIRHNLRPFRHPYYTRYLPLQQLCLQILRNESMMYASGRNELSGILIDGSWLWEEYVAKLLPQFNHPHNRKQRGGLPLFSDRNYPQYPDFYNHDIVLDAKYKRLENTIGREDIHQLVTYMYMMQTKYGGYIYPYSSKEIYDLPYSPSSKYGTLMGYGGIVYRYGIEICSHAKDYPSFCNEMKMAELVFQQELIKRLAQSNETI